MRTIAVTNQKGGCGKTTVSINLAACLAQEGRSVLLVDMDPQGHCALGLSVPEEQIEYSVADVILQDAPDGPVEIEHAIWQISKNFDFLPSTIGLVRFETVLAAAPDRDLHLRTALEGVAHRYDYAIVDCPPHVGLLTYNALRAAGEAIIPVETGYFSLQGLGKQVNTIRDLVARTGEQIKICVLANSYDVRTKLAREILNELRRKYDDIMLRSYINFNTKLKEGASYGQAITEYDAASMGHRDFARLARELVEMEEPMGLHADLLIQANCLAARAEELLAGTSVLSDRAGEATRAALQCAEVMGDCQPMNASHRPTIATPAEIDRRIDAIYGVQRLPDGVELHIKIAGAEEILIAGDFNNWLPQSSPMIKEDGSGRFKARLRLTEGRYRYRLVVDGRWTRDPCNQFSEVNEFGEMNSVFEIS